MTKDIVVTQEAFYNAFLGIETCYNPDYESMIKDYDKQVAEYKEAIEEIEFWINYSIQNEDKREVASWRRLLQQTKKEYRNLKTVFKKKHKEIIAA